MSQSGASNAQNLGQEAKTVVDLVGSIAGLFIPGGTVIAGLALPEIIKIAEGVAEGAPQVIAAFNDFKAAVEGGAAPSPDQLAALKASIDADAQQLEKDIATLDAEDEAAAGKKPG